MIIETTPSSTLFHPSLSVLNSSGKTVNLLNDGTAPATSPPPVATTVPVPDPAAADSASGDFVKREVAQLTTGLFDKPTPAKSVTAASQFPSPPPSSQGSPGSSPSLDVVDDAIVSATSVELVESASTTGNDSDNNDNNLRPFRCKYNNCSKAFTTSAHLSRHAKLHLGWKPYRCMVPNCDKSFSRRDNMMVHFRSHLKKHNTLEQQKRVWLSGAPMHNTHSTVTYQQAPPHTDIHGHYDPSLPRSYTREYITATPKEGCVEPTFFKEVVRMDTSLALQLHYLLKQDIATAAPALEDTLRLQFLTSGVPLWQPPLATGLVGLDNPALKTTTHTPQKPFSCTAKGCGKAFTSRCTVALILDARVLNIVIQNCFITVEQVQLRLSNLRKGVGPMTMSDEAINARVPSAFDDVDLFDDDDDDDNSEGGEEFVIRREEDGEGSTRDSAVSGHDEFPQEISTRPTPPSADAGQDAGANNGGVSTSEPGASSSGAKASFAYTPSNDVGTFLTMGLDDLDALTKAPSTVASRYNSARNHRATKEYASGNNVESYRPTATHVDVDPQRALKTLDTVKSVVSSVNKTGTVSGAVGLDATSPMFNGVELASLIDQILTRLAQDCNLSIDDVSSCLKLATEKEAATITGIQDRQVRTLITSLQIKLKTSQSVINELGKKVDRAQRSSEGLASKIATLEMEKATHGMVVEKMKAQMKELELRAVTAENAINVYNRTRQVQIEQGGSGGWGSRPGTWNEEGGIEAEDAQAESPPGTGTTLKNPGSAPEASNSGGSSQRRQKPSRKDMGVRVLDTHAETENSEQESGKPETLDESLSEVEDDGYLGRDTTEEDSKEPMTKITRTVIRNTARMLAAKKKFDPPSVHGAVHKNNITKEEHSGPASLTPRNLLKPQYHLPPSGSGYKPSSHITKLAHNTLPEAPLHLSNVLAAQTQELLSTRTPEAYLKVLHAQVSEMTMALHECIDALAEERRVGERWKRRWERLYIKLKKDAEKRKREKDEKVMNGRRRRYLLNALLPMFEDDVLRRFISEEDLKRFRKLKGALVEAMGGSQRDGGKEGGVQYPIDLENMGGLYEGYSKPGTPMTPGGNRPQYHTEDGMTYSAPPSRGGGSNMSRPPLIPSSPGRVNYVSASNAGTPPTTTTLPDLKATMSHYIPGVRGEEYHDPSREFDYGKPSASLPFTRPVTSSSAAYFVDSTDSNLMGGIPRARTSGSPVRPGNYITSSSSSGPLTNGSIPPMRRLSRPVTSHASGSLHWESAFSTTASIKPPSAK
ncbi:hypothetical protein HDV05_003539 [Chytridiales sp. JEL 0842]|nr:hypothetical protein HDV05_003539 [Chytridiales sp. JEL 0842]